MIILKIPYNAGAMSVGKGIEQGPEAILKSLAQFHLSESGFLANLDVREVKTINTNIEESRKIMKSMVPDTMFIALGGDHSITEPLFEGLKGRNPGIVVFDAHPDMMPPSFTHEDWLSGLIDRKILKASNMVLVGMRNPEPEELEYIRKHRLNIFSMKEIAQKGITDVSDAVMSVARQWDSLYISIDIDVLDPAFAPGTGYRVPGGMTSRELLYFVQRLRLLRNFRAADIVEVNALHDVQDMTAAAAAKLCLELC